MSYDYVVDTGVIIPDTSEVLMDVQEEQKTIFGNDFDVSDATPQGVQINAEAEARRSVIRNNAQVGNQLNPNLAGGTALDAIWALTGGERSRGTFSTVEVRCFGEDGTIISVGSEVQDENGLTWTSTVAGTIGAITSGEVDITFLAPEVGSTQAGPNTITTILTVTEGWDSADNPDAADPGTLTTSDPVARSQRRSQLGLQGISATTAIIARVSAVNNVRSVVSFDNDTPNDINFEGVLIPKNSIYVCVDGGGNSEIAEALFNAKTLGAAFSGDISTPIINGSNPNPYIVRHSNSTPVPIFVEIDVRLTNSAIVDPTNQVKNAMLAYANGELSPYPGFTAGSDANPFELSGAVQQLVLGTFTTDIKISKTAGPTDTEVIPININEVATLDENNIAVNIV